MTRHRPGGATVVLRSTTGVLAAAVGAVAATALVIQALLLGRPDTVLAAGPWLLGGVWLLVLLLARPHVRLEPGRAVVVGVLRRHELPWGAVRDASLRPQVRFTLRDGRRITSWDGSRHDRDDALRAVVHQRIDAAEPSAHDDVPAATSRWDAPAVAVTAVLAALCAASVLP